MFIVSGKWYYFGALLDSTELRSLRSRRDLGLNVLHCAHAGGIWSNPKGEGRGEREREMRLAAEDEEREKRALRSGIRSTVRICGKL
jgi:hypothetical protein